MSLPRNPSLIAVAAMLLMAGPACDDKRRHQPSDAAPIGAIAAAIPKDAPPGLVAQNLLQSLIDLQRARAAGLGSAEKKAAYDQAMAKAWSLAAAAEIHQGLLASGTLNIPRDISEKAALTLVTESWASMIAHYIDGIEFGKMATSPENPQTAAVAYLEAESPSDREALRAAGNNQRATALQKGVCPPIAVGITVRLTKVADGWRVNQLDIGPARRS